MSNIMVGIIILFAVLWFYSFTSIIGKKFKNKTTKQILILAITLLPIIAFIYIFFEDDYVQDDYSASLK